jgi:hypothetical protein
MYNIILSDPNKKSVSSVGSIKFIDQNATDYGSVFWSNILRLVENYSSHSPPSSPIEGQLWYNPSTYALSVATVTAAGLKEWQLVSDVYDDTALIYIDKYSRNTIKNLTIPTSNPSKGSNYAATKKYADDWHSGIVTGKNTIANWTIYPNRYCVMFGTGTGAIKLPFDMLDTNYAVIVTNSGTASTTQYATSKSVKGFTISNNSWMLVGYTK